MRSPFCGKGSCQWPEQVGNKMDNENASAAAEMPRYVSHKTVWALKIKSIDYDTVVAEAENRDSDGSATITPADEHYAPFKVDHAYYIKHDPQPGGYYVVYADGYKSFSPAEPFEQGYTLVR